MNKSQPKASTIPLSADKLAFLPAAVEIQAAPPAKWSRSLLWAVIALLTIAIIWACWAKIDIIAVAQGKLVPQGQVKIVQPLETGVIKSIFVREGQQVNQGDKLVMLDGTVNQAEAKRLTEQKQGLVDDLQRQQYFLNRLNQQASIATSENILSRSQQALFDANWQEYQAKIASYNSELGRLLAERKANLIDVNRLTQTLPLVIEREQSYQSLLTSSAVSRNQYLELKQQRIDQQESLKRQQANVEQISASILAAQQNLAAFIAETKRTVLNEVNQLQREVVSINQQLTKANKLSELQLLTAPIDGIVEQLAVTTIGGVVTPAQELLHIVPTAPSNTASDSNAANALLLKVEAGLQNKDIGFVYKGQPAEVKIDSFPFSKYGVIDAEITDISADAIEVENVGLLFPLQAKLAKNTMNIDGKKINLQAGMTVSIEIKTGQRRLIEFLLAPLLKGVSEGARER